MSRRRALAGAGTLLFAPLPGCFIFAEPLPVIGFISSHAPDSDTAAANVDALRRGLAEQGFVDGDRVTIESRYADGQMEQVPALAQQLVDMNVAVIVVGTRRAARMVQSVAGKTPIVFAQVSEVTEDTGELGANVTGVANNGNLDLKRLQLLHPLVPLGAKIACVGDPNLATYDRDLAATEDLARQLNRPVLMLKAGNDTELVIAYRKLSSSGIGGVLIGAMRGLRGHPEKLVSLAARRKLPAVYFDRTFVDAGGLMSYGASYAEAFRQVGIYAGRILKGARPQDLPVVDPHATELIVNLNAARLLSLTIPADILAQARQVVG